MGSPDRIGVGNFRNGKIVLALRIGTGRAFHKAGPDDNYANGVHLGAVLENTALVQGIRCEPLGQLLIPWTCAVWLSFFISL